MSPVSPVQIGDGIAARVSPARAERVLWIHGYTLDSSIWDDLWSRLPAWHHIGIDLPGHGASERMAAGEDLGELGRRIGDLALEYEVRHLVGLSFGGMVALQVAIEMPSAFASLVLGSPGLGGAPQDPYARARNLELTRLYRERGSGPWMGDVWMKSPPDIFKGAASYSDLWQKLREVVDRHPWSELGDGTMQGLANYPQPEQHLRRIEAETLILVGEEDMGVFKRYAEVIRRSIPACERVYLPGVGHLGLLEAPATVGALIAAHWRASPIACHQVGIEEGNRYG